MSHQAAVDALGKMSRVFKAFEDADVALKALASLEQHEKEMRKAVTSVKAEKEKVDAEIIDSKEALKKVKASIKKAEDDAAERMQAQIDADNAQRAKDADEAASVLKDLRVKALAAAEERDAAEKARDAAKAELANVTAKLETTRSQIAKMLG
jgi:chromosome segregation ATPase